MAPWMSLSQGILLMTCFLNFESQIPKSAGSLLNYYSHTAGDELTQPG
jgi:hypothetical protein